jgi:hypothetical protein
VIPKVMMKASAMDSRNFMGRRSLFYAGSAAFFRRDSAR